jgi:hypothetical protein
MIEYLLQMIQSQAEAGDVRRAGSRRRALTGQSVLHWAHLRRWRFDCCWLGNQFSLTSLLHT